MVVASGRVSRTWPRDCQIFQSWPLEIVGRATFVCGAAMIEVRVANCQGSQSLDLVGREVMVVVERVDPLVMVLDRDEPVGLT